MIVVNPGRIHLRISAEAAGAQADGTLAPEPSARQAVGMGTDRLTWFNKLPTGEAQQVLLECCSAPGWTVQMAAARPYASVQDAIRQSSAVVAAMTAADLAEALAGHPRIGERPEPAGDDSPAAGWSRREQSGVGSGDTALRRALAEANLEYEQQFGHIYLVCASGRTGTELLSVLRSRLQNDPGTEWQVVRNELQKINELRLQRLVTDLAELPREELPRAESP